jgi:hypothetical protein
VAIHSGRLPSYKPSVGADPRPDDPRRQGITPSPPIPGELDPGIRRAVDQLQACGIETFESCEGGPGHAFPEPTVRFYGTPEAGWRAVGICLAYGLPILSLRRVWHMLDPNEPTGPHWEITFRERILD